jgi:hypothetical protein
MKETITERKVVDKELAELNISLEEELKMNWELSSGVSHINLRQRPSGRQL